MCVPTMHQAGRQSHSPRPKRWGKIPSLAGSCACAPRPVGRTGSRKLARKPRRPDFENGAYEMSCSWGGRVVGPHSTGLTSTSRGAKLAMTPSRKWLGPVWSGCQALRGAMDIEVLELSASSKEAQEKHAEMLLKVSYHDNATYRWALSLRVCYPAGMCVPCRAAVMGSVDGLCAGRGRAPCAQGHRADGPRPSQAAASRARASRVPVRRGRTLECRARLCGRGGLCAANWCRGRHVAAVLVAPSGCVCRTGSTRYPHVGSV